MEHEQMSTKAEEVEWIMIHDAMEILSVSRDAVRALIREGRLTVRRIPCAWLRLRRDEVEAMAADCTRSATAKGPLPRRKRKAAAGRSPTRKAAIR
jgi:hypothetical protein